VFLRRRTNNGCQNDDDDDDDDDDEYYCYYYYNNNDRDDEDFEKLLKTKYRSLTENSDIEYMLVAVKCILGVNRSKILEYREP
jgi:hypothetical protein